ncbi:MAG TPA: thioredoxin domain-containing protein, partial [Planctomycetota bacterium]|nr:thioredoxin domain-containing protein [Planctomycetota bacterium]
REHGGFGPAPKFPRPVDLSFLLRVYGRTGDSTVLAICEKTLEEMARGGIYDQIGGGFHRYSTDARWLVPHFEKMLYDNALLARTYLEAHLVTGLDLYRTIATETLDWILREMTSEEGGFFSATDADSEGGEGRFFVWTSDEIENLLGDRDARIVCSYYGITPQGNFEDGRSIAHVARDASQVAAEHGIDLQELEETIVRARQRLYDARERRPKPFRDEKVITSWNALALAAFARAAQVTGSEAYLTAAQRAADLILDTLTANGRLLRTRKDGESKIPGFLDDHAYLADALLDLWETTFDVRWLREARRIADFALEHFRDPEGGGFFYTASDQEALIVRRAEIFDGATPASGAVLALALLRLERLSGEGRYRDAAKSYLESVRAPFDQAPMAFAATLTAADFAIHGPAEVAVVGDPSAARTRELIDAVHGTFVPARIVAACAPEETERLATDVPLLAGKGGGDRPRAFLCRNYTCGAPIESADELRAGLAVASAAAG